MADTLARILEAADVAVTTVRGWREVGEETGYSVVLVDGYLADTVPEWAAPKLLPLLSRTAAMQAGSDGRAGRAPVRKPVRRRNLLRQIAVAAGCAEVPVEQGAGDGAGAALAARFSGQYRVLIAEDTPSSRTVLIHMLRTFGIEPWIALDGEEAWEIVQRGPLDLLITDCQMPELDGFELTRRIRSTEATNGDRRSLPVVALSASTLQDDKERCRAAGMSDFLEKPISLPRLSKVLSRWLGQPTTGQAVTPGPETDDSDLNIQMYKELFDNDPAELRKMLDEFLTRTGELTGELLRAIEAADEIRVSKVAHRLAGNSLTAGAMRFGHLCREIELTARRSDPAALHRLLVDFEPAFARLRQAIGTLKADRAAGVMP